MPEKGRVLIVDDNPYSADTLAELLRDNDYVVSTAVRGDDALALLADVEPNLIMLDAHIRDADPFKLCATMKTAEQTRDVSVIFMSAVEDDEARLKGFELGDDGFTDGHGGVSSGSPRLFSRSAGNAKKISGEGPPVVQIRSHAV